MERRDDGTAPLFRRRRPPPTARLVLFDSTQPNAVMTLALALGVVLGLGWAMVVIGNAPVVSLGLYLVALSVYHFFEGWCTATFNTDAFTTNCVHCDSVI